MDNTNEKIALALQELCEQGKKSNASRIREYLPKIEAALNAGNTHSEIFTALKNAGLNTTIKTYLNEFYRARHKLSPIKTATPSRKELPTQSAKQEPALPPKHAPRGFNFQPLKPGDEKNLY